MESEEKPVQEKKKPKVKLPAFKLPKNLSYTPLLVIVLIVGAYYIGSLRSEVKSLRKDGGGVTATQVTTGSNPAALQQPAQAVAIPIVTDDDHRRGNPEAKLVMVVYSDYECPFCKQFHTTLQSIVKTYGDDVAWVYRHYPLAIHANAQKQAEAAECISELGGDAKFWDFTDKLFERTTSNGSGFALDKLGSLAAEVGIDQAKFQTCLDSGKYYQPIQDTMKAAGSRGTPSTFVFKTGGGTPTPINGALPIEQVKQTLDSLLK